MSPHAALQSEIFRNYCLIVGILLAAAAIALGALKWVARKEVGSIWITYRSWLWIAPLIFGGLFAGRIAFIVLVTMLALQGFKEFARATGLYHDWGMTGTAYAGIVAVAVASLIRQPQGEEPGEGWYGFFIALPVFVIAAILLVPIVRNQVEGQLQRMSLAIVGFVYIGWMFGHLAFLANATHAYGYLLYILFATEVNDVAAFTFGKLFGRHPFRSQISPKKTWEGAIGALTVSMVLPWLLRFSFPHFGAAQLLLTGLIVGVGGQLGDLAISVIKRDVGIKDMGASIAGHGGVLDRIDSLIYVAPLFFHSVGYFFGLR
jgi:phosphatidate cytidylyltransferase